MKRPLIVEHLRNELLVYDPETHRAHALSGEAARLFARRRTDSSRRQVLKYVAAGVVSVAAPTVAQACSNPHATSHCGRGENGRVCTRADDACGRCFGGSCR